MNKFIELIIKELLENIHYLSNVMVFIKPIDIAHLVTYYHKQIFFEDKIIFV